MVKNFFRSVDEKLTAIEDYIDLRVRSGKFIADLPIISNLLTETAKERITHFWNIFYKSSITQSFLSLLKKAYHAAMAIPFFEIIISFLIESLRIISWGFIEISFTITLSIFSVFYLVREFQNSPLIFFITLPFILLINLFFLSTLYIYLEKKIKHTGINWLSAIKDAGYSLPSVTMASTYYISMMLSGIIFFFITSLYYSFFFDFLSLDWGKSFYYWILVVLLALFILITLFLTTIIFPHIFLFILLSKNSTSQSIETSIKFLKSYPLQISAFNLALLAIFLLGGAWALTKYYYIGIGLTVFAYFHAKLFLGFLLQRKLIEKISSPAIDHRKYKLFLTILPLIGLSTYVLSAAFIIKHYKAIDQLFIEEKATNFTRFKNETHGYSIDYPKEWTEYHTNMDSITIYNNETETNVGGVWIVVSVSPQTPEFETLLKSKPGLVYYETVTNNVTTKITNLLTEGYQTIKYTYIKNEASHAEYQIHYLIRKGEKEYDIQLKTVNKDVEGKNAELFDQVFASFRFLDQ